MALSKKVIQGDPWADLVSLYLVLQFSKCTLNTKAGSPENSEGPFRGLTKSPKSEPCPRTSWAASGQCHTQGLPVCLSVRPSSLPVCLQTPLLTPLVHSVTGRAHCATSCQSSREGNLLPQGSQGQSTDPTQAEETRYTTVQLRSWYPTSHAAHYWQTEIEVLSPHRASSVGFWKYAGWQKFQGQHKLTNCTLTSLHIVQKLVFQYR